MRTFDRPDLKLPEHAPQRHNVNFDGSFDDTAEYMFGKQAILMKPGRVREVFPEISKLYPGKRLAIKFFPVSEKHSYPWLEEITKIQNMFSWKGLAPRVYDIIRVGNYHGQLVEFIDGEYCQKPLVLHDYHKLLEHPYIATNGDLKASNLVGYCWVDFGGFKFIDYDDYAKEVRDFYIEHAKWGGDGAYQQNKELSIYNGRGEKRIEQFGLEDYDFEGKTVLDLGCSGGYFTNYCASRGARAIGIDTDSVARAAREAANLLGIFSAEYYHINLTDKFCLEQIKATTGLDKFDYVFFLSMDQHVGFKDWLGDIARTLFFESNGGKPEQEEYEIFKPKLDGLFSQVEHKGLLSEPATRNLFVCRK